MEYSKDALVRNIVGNWIEILQVNNGRHMAEYSDSYQRVKLYKKTMFGKSLISEDTYSHIIEEFENAGRKHS